MVPGATGETTLYTVNLSVIAAAGAAIVAARAKKPRLQRAYRRTFWFYFAADTTTMHLDTCSLSW